MNNLIAVNVIVQLNVIGPTSHYPFFHLLPDKISFCRSRVAIIPQTPFLFSGTIRENLDPCQLYADDELWQVLSKCHLNTTVSSLGGLYTELAERGRLFSIGQSQLLCLARAMLLKSTVRYRLCIISSSEFRVNIKLLTHI